MTYSTLTNLNVWKGVEVGVRRYHTTTPSPLRGWGVWVWVPHLHIQVGVKRPLLTTIIGLVPMPGLLGGGDYAGRGFLSSLPKRGAVA